MEARTGISYCSACFQGKPNQVHVDFDAAWDGPAMTDAEGQPVSYAIDELVICEDCLKAAGALIGLAPSDEADKVQRLERQILELSRKSARDDEALRSARLALGEPVAALQQGQDIPKPKRGPGRPRKNPVPA